MAAAANNSGKLLVRKGRKLLRAVARLLPPRATYRVRRALGHSVSPPVGQVCFGDFVATWPVSPDFGFERGTPIDRYYIDAFLGRFQEDIQGVVLEVGSADYTQALGGAQVSRSEILDIDRDNSRATVLADLAYAPHIADDQFDCIVLTQVLHLIFDMRAAVATLHRILKPGGVVLVTVPGITPIDRGAAHDSWCWSLTERAARRLFETAFAPGQVSVETHGNIFSATCFIQGLAVEELPRSKLDVVDPCLPVTVAIRARKAAGD